MCNCTCADTDAFGPQESHEVAALIFVVLTLVSCVLFLAWPTCSSVCCPKKEPDEQEADLALSLLQMPPPEPPRETTYSGTHVKVHEMDETVDSTDSEADEVIGPNSNVTNSIKDK